MYIHTEGLLYQRLVVSYLVGSSIDPVGFAPPSPSSGLVSGPEHKTECLVNGTVRQCICGRNLPTYLGT